MAILCQHGEESEIQGKAYTIRRESKIKTIASIMVYGA